MTIGYVNLRIGIKFYRKFKFLLSEFFCHLRVVWKDKLDLQIVQGIWLGPWSKGPIRALEFIEN